MLEAPSALPPQLDELPEGAPTDVDDAPTLPHLQLPHTALAEGSQRRPPASADPLIDSYLGNYRVVRRIGSGGGGVVYEAVHCHLGRRAAIKVLRDNLHGDPEHIQRFRSEAIAAARIGHRGVVSVLDYGYDARGLAYLIMEYVDGISLQDAMRPGRLELSRAIDIAERLASTMAAAHGAGVVHRDLKPANVLVARDSVGRDHIKILDFGVAKLVGVDACDHAHTRIGTVLGTPLYMPPEQVRGVPGTDPRSDIYSLGCVMFEMVTGLVPFTGSSPEILSAHVERAVPRTSQFRHSVSPELCALIASMMAKDPDARPPSMAIVSSSLCRISKIQRAWATTGRPAARPGSSRPASHPYSVSPTIVRPRQPSAQRDTYQPTARATGWRRLAAAFGLLCG